MRNDPKDEVFKQPPNKFGTYDIREIEPDEYPNEYVPNEWCRCFAPERPLMPLFASATMFGRLWIGNVKEDGRLAHLPEEEMNKVLFDPPASDLGPRKNYVTYAENMIFIYSQSIRDHEEQYQDIMDLIRVSKYSWDVGRVDYNITKDQFEQYGIGLEIWQDRLVELYDDSEWIRSSRGRPFIPSPKFGSQV